MQILQVHKYFWKRDGASNYMLHLSKLLKEAGHSVSFFSMKQKQSLTTPYSKYFVDEMKLDDPKRISFSKKIHHAKNIFFNTQARKKIERLLDEHPVDIVHLHNIYHHISPSILAPIKKKGVPIVMTLHDYKIISPNYTLYHHGSIHEEDARGLHLSCIKNKCHKDSRAQSTLLSAEMIFHHKIMRYYEKYVDAFIAPSMFMKNICAKYGWDEKGIHHIRHPIDTSSYSEKYENRGYVAYAGRLSEEKGIKTLLKAAMLTPHIPYKIIGDGPLSSFAKAFVNKHNLTNVDLTGFKTGAALTKLLSYARLHVLASEWYENYPLSILEAHALGKVVIATRMGGIPELVPDRQLVKPHSEQALAQKIATWFAYSEKQLKTAGAHARARVEKTNDPKKHLKQMLDLYHRYAA